MAAALGPLAKRADYPTPARSATLRGALRGRKRFRNVKTTGRLENCPTAACAEFFSPIAPTLRTLNAVEPGRCPAVVAEAVRWMEAQRRTD